MPAFLYKAKDTDRHVIEGTIEAESEAAALDRLASLGYFPMAITEAQPTQGPAATAAAAPGRRRRVRTRDLSLLTRQLADLVGSGVTLLDGLNLLRHQTEHPTLRFIAQELARSIKDGLSFSDALAKHPTVFSPIYVAMVHTGEIGGVLEQVLTRLADLSEAEDELKSRVQLALVYPSLIILVGIATITILLTFVIPRLVSLFQEMGQVLPLPTRILIAISRSSVQYWWAEVLVTVASVGWYQWQRATPSGRRAIDRSKLRLPLFGPLIQQVELARFSRSLSVLLNHGVPILQALEVVSQSLTNAVLQEDVRRIQREVRDGSALAKAMGESQLISPFMTNMVAVGEEAGLLDSSLMKVATAYEREADRMMKLLTSMLGPLLIVIVGAAVAFIVIAMLLPIFQMGVIAQ
ncbi:MAG: type II secretion system F family protein [Candidatus Omnitrophica bacterium]|nr:type II secretion system F family protein [Candidatus Omnitrophota bacterium]